MQNTSKSIMNLENEIINYMDKMVEDHPEIPSYIFQTILEDICEIINDKMLEKQ